MTVRVLALQSGVTGLEDHRLLLSGLVAGAGTLDSRSGIFPAPGAADLTTVSAMVCSIAPFRAWIDGKSATMQGGYPFASDADVQIAFADGEASVDRTDRIAAVVHDDPYDASGKTLGEVAYLKGQPTGQPSAWPDSFEPLYEIVVPAGTSAGTGGVDFATATDVRTYTATAGGIIPVGSRADRDAIVNPHSGMAIHRTDWGWIETYDGVTWRVQGTATASSLSALQTGITDPYQGQLAVTRDVNALYLYDGIAWGRYADSGWLDITAQCTALNGTTLNEVTVRRYGPVVALYAITILGTDISVPSSGGNVGNTELFTLPAAWWPSTTLGHQQNVGGSGATGPTANFLTDPADGGILISATTPGTSLSSGTELDISGQYLQD